MVLDVGVDGSSRSSAVSIGAEACHLSLSVTPAFHKLDAYLGGTVAMMVFVSSTCDMDVPFRWEVPASESVQVTLEPASGVLLPWATLVSELRITGLRAGPYGYYCIPCWLEDRSFSAPLTLYGEVMALSASVHIAPNWGYRPAGVPDLGEGRQVLGRSRRRQLEQQQREAQEEAARLAAQPPPEPEKPPTPPPSPKSKKDKKKSPKAAKKGKKKGKDRPPTPEPEPEPEPPPPPEPERAPTPEPTVEELVAEWELVESAEAGCGSLVLLFGHDVDIHSVVVRELHVRNNTPITMQCSARVLNFPGLQQERCAGEPPMTVEKRRINDLEREDVWSELLSDGRGLALLVRPARFAVPAHSQTLVRVFCCADMWGWYSDQLIVSGEGIPDLTVDLRVGVTGSPLLAVNTGSNHVRFGCQLYGGAPVERHLCLNNVSPCPIQLNMAVALETPVEERPPPFCAFLSLGADFEPLLPLWEWRVTSDTLRLGLRPVFGQESQAYYTVTPEVTVVPARSKVWVLLQLHPVCLPPAASRWERERRQRPVDVLAWLTAHCSLREQDRAPPGGLVTRRDGYSRRPLQVQLRAQLRSAYLTVAYPETAAVGFRPPPVLAGAEEAVRMVAPVTALVEGPRRSVARLLSRLTIHNKHQVDVEVICWTTLPFMLVRAASPRGAVERPGRCVVPHSGHTQLTVEFVFSRALLRFCLTERLTEPRRVRFSPGGEVEVLDDPDWSDASDGCPPADDAPMEEETRSAELLTGSERAPSEPGSDPAGSCRARARSEPDLGAAAAGPSASLQQLLCSRSAEMTAEQRAADFCLREVEVVHLTTDSGEERVRFRSKLVLQYMDSHVQAFPVECILALPALRVSVELIEFKQVTVGDVAKRGLYISNPTIGELSWSARLVARLPSPQTSVASRLSRRRSTRLAPRRPDAATFRLSPEFGVLAPRARQHVSLTFAPASCALYSATLELSGPCLPDPVCVLVTGEGTHDELPHMPGT
ncbi:uncharacterized protein LOC122384571 [Amphibalanus amphitrite]|uniref:uncharacterized protein LOC122384571 n=1 Tax=Amphibalanus amphitrite TaxID=1232801 RepID=UPI001C90FF12|nr:uncharacterized protein LOC122384571 [Amphibalanus amphitrite]